MVYFFVACSIAFICCECSIFVFFSFFLSFVVVSFNFSHSSRSHFSSNILLITHTHTSAHFNCCKSQRNGKWYFRIVAVFDALFFLFCLRLYCSHVYFLLLFFLLQISGCCLFGCFSTCYDFGVCNWQSKNQIYMDWSMSHGASKCSLM